MKGGVEAPGLPVSISHYGGQIGLVFSTQEEEVRNVEEPTNRKVKQEILVCDGTAGTLEALHLVRMINPLSRSDWR